MEVRPARGDEVDQALALVASAGAGAPSQAATALRDAADRAEFDLANLTVAVDGGRLVGACLVIVTPGRTAFTTVPAAIRRRLEGDVTLALAAYWRREAARRGLAMLQAFLPIGDRRHQVFLEEAGFDHLADLIYLARETAVRTGEGEPPPGLTWRTYSAETHGDFVRVLAETYRESLDCPGLEGLRSVSDVIAGHKAQGLFEPERWFLLERAGLLSGCLLLNEIPERDSLDITYMGLVPEARGSGLGGALVGHALEETRRAHRPKLTCAVDADNVPAIKTYRRFGFRSLDTRRVLLALPHDPTETEP